MRRSRALEIELSHVAPAEGQALGHVERDLAVGSDVGPEQRGEAALVFGGEYAPPFGLRLTGSADSAR